MPAPHLASLQARLRREIEGDVLFGADDRGRYSTDASIYQIEPLGVVVPRSATDAQRALEIAADCGVPLLPRGAGTSQCGQTVGAALVLDTSKHLRELLELDVEARTAWVEPGIVLDELNARLKPHGLWYSGRRLDVRPGDPRRHDRQQQLRRALAALRQHGAQRARGRDVAHERRDRDVRRGRSRRRGRACPELRGRDRRATTSSSRLVRALHERERDEIAARVPHVQRRVAGYNLDMASSGAFNMAHLLVGSEGTLGYFRKLKLKLAPLPRHKALGIVHFPTFYRAMDLTREIVSLEPTAVELVDRTMIDLSREIATFRATVAKTIRGDPDAILLVEFAGDELAPQVAKLHA